MPAELTVDNEGNTGPQGGSLIQSVGSRRRMTYKRCFRSGSPKFVGNGTRCSGISWFTSFSHDVCPGVTVPL